ncbi:MAG: MmcQ/YjbR family DNA-binding protein [Bacteroidota bacterium]
MFLITSPDNFPVSASFKSNADEFEELINRPGFIPAPYLARNKWVSVDDINRMNEKERHDVLSLSYDLVFSGLPAKIRKQILES